MGPTVRALVAPYGMALLAVAVALSVRLILDPLAGDRLPFLFPCLAVVAVAWYGGFGPSFVALVLGLVLSAYLFLQPRYDLPSSVSAHQFQVSGYLFLGVTIGLFSEGLRAARRRAEAHAREAIARRNELEQEIAQRKWLEHEFEQRAEQLAEADRRKDEFLAMLGHELRNPLGPIKNAVEVLRLLGVPDANPTLGPAKVALGHPLEMIERQVQHLTRLVDDLLDVSRITRGKITLKKEPVDLAAVIARAVETSRPLIEANRHALSVSLFPKPISVVADPVRLEQVFANLLNNSAKYTERGGHIWLTGEQQGGEVLVRVRDTGFGISAEALPHIFDLFSQAEPTLDRSQGGLGIGLTLVKSLVEMHGGGVTAHSKGQGQGTEVVVRLPIGAEASPGEKPRESAPAPPVPNGPPLRVLVVEDNQDAAASLAILLRIWGYEVRTSHDGLSGVKAACAYRPQIVLLDIGLPGLDGYEVARRLRKELGPQVRLVAMTGYGQEEDLLKSRAAGLDAHLVKPADPETLRASLAALANP